MCCSDRLNSPPKTAAHKYEYGSVHGTAPDVPFFDASTSPYRRLAKDELGPYLGISGRERRDAPQGSDKLDAVRCHRDACPRRASASAVPESTTIDRYARAKLGAAYRRAGERP